MNNKRKHERKQTPLYLKIYDKEDDHFLGSLVDLTIEGMKIYSWRSLKEGEHFTCELILPDAIKGKKQIELDTKCVWCKSQSRTEMDFYMIGLELESISLEKRKILQQSLDRFFTTIDGRVPTEK